MPSHCTTQRSMPRWGKAQRTPFSGSHCTRAVTGCGVDGAQPLLRGPWRESPAVMAGPRGCRVRSGSAQHTTHAWLRGISGGEARGTRAGGRSQPKAAAGTRRRCKAPGADRTSPRIPHARVHNRAQKPALMRAHALLHASALVRTSSFPRAHMQTHTHTHIRMSASRGRACAGDCMRRSGQHVACRWRACCATLRSWRSRPVAFPPARSALPPGVL